MEVTLPFKVWIFIKFVERSYKAAKSLDGLNEKNDHHFDIILRIYSLNIFETNKLVANH